MEGPGALAGWEFSEQIDAKELGQTIAQQALVKLGADACPSGEMPVVIGNGFGGVIFHEALWPPARNHFGCEEGVGIPRQNG